ncbi:MAG: CpXC domain-containing protein [Fibrobacterota bacterium]
MPVQKEWVGITCPQCRAQEDVFVTRVADVHEEPALREALFRGELNMFHCVQCKSRLHYDDYLLYSDREKGLLVNVFAEKEKPEHDRICRRMFEDLRRLPFDSRVPNFIVYGYGRLAKIAALLEMEKGGRDNFQRLFVLSEEWLASPDYASDESAGRREAAELRFERALTLHKEGDYAAAAQAYEHILKEFPDYYNALFNAGLLYFNQLDKSGQALERFEKCRDLRPNDGEILFGLGQIHLKRKELEAAIPFFMNAIIVAPFSSLSWFNLGLGLAMGGEKEEGLEALETSLELASNKDDKNVIARTIARVSENPA